MALAFVNPEAPPYRVILAKTPNQVQQSQALRYTVFSTEMGAKLNGSELGLDLDYYDGFCEHLLVIDNKTNQLVGSTRLLDRQSAAQAGGFYSQSEFQIDAILAQPGTILELGRTCIHAEHRNGTVIGLLWQGLGDIIQARNVDYLIGCASIEWQATGAMVHAVMDRFRKRYMVDPALRVTPKYPVPDQDQYATVTALKIPPLLKAYVGLGAKVCGEPCWDRDFGVADVFMMLDFKHLSPRYARHFLK